jgi:uncharacterized membrane protein
MTERTLGPEEAAKLDHIEALLAELREEAGQAPESAGARAADKVSRVVGSWKFLITWSIALLGWMGLNGYLLAANPFDPYPFILLNLVLSFQAGLTGPVILMAQNRTDAKDRKSANKAYRTIGQMEQMLKHLSELEGVDTAQDSESSE